jgi:exopolysaccharide biosynthesis polyprenyl glycosylphosphotransferase
VLGRLDKLAPGVHSKLTLVVDLAIVVCALLASIDWTLPYAGSHAWGLAILGLASWGVGGAVVRLYSPYTPRRASDGATLAIVASVGTVASVTLVDVLFLGAPPYHIQAFQFGTLIGIGALGTQLLLLRPLRQRGEPTDDVLVVGTGPLGRATASSLAGRRNVVGFLRFDDEPGALPDGAGPLLGDAADLLDVLKRHAVDEVFLADRVMTRGFEMQRLVKQLEELGIPFAVPVHSLRFNRAQLMSNSLGKDGYLHYLNTPSRPLQLAVKRLLDIVLATLGLLALSPLLIGVAIAIKATSQGPVLFRQTRVGLHGATFNFLKFRSMVTDAESMKDSLLAQNERESGPAFKMKNDPRVTAVGRFIRKFSIDELPQLVNILRGDMTIVGPRPPVPREVEQYSAWQRRRLSVRPGLTCYWQVGGRDEIGFDEWMLLDLRYVDHWSLRTDFELILKTFPVVLFGRGAS